MRYLNIVITLLLFFPNISLSDMKAEKTKIEFRIVYDDKCYVCKKVEYHDKYSNKSETLHLGKIELSNHHIARASSVIDQYTGPTAFLYLNKEGKKKLSNITATNLNKRMAIIVNERIISAPKIVHRIDDGSVRITGNITKQEVDDIVNDLNRRQQKMEI